MIIVDHMESGEISLLNKGARWKGSAREEVGMLWWLFAFRLNLNVVWLLLFLLMVALPYFHAVILQQSAFSSSFHQFTPSQPSQPSHSHSLSLILSLPFFFSNSPQILLFPSYQYRYKTQEYQYFTFNLLPMHPQPSDFVFKILLIGNSAVGKTSLLERFAQQVFHESLLSTIGVDLKIRTIRNGKTVTKMQVWDTAGQQRFKALSSSAYRDTQGMILVFDLTDKKSFEEIGSWLDEADRHINPEYVRILLGNKCDLHANRQVSFNDAQRYAQKEGMAYFQTSAKENINVNAVFQRLSGEMKQRFSEQYLEKYKRTKVYLKPIMDGRGGNVSKTCW